MAIIIIGLVLIALFFGSAAYLSMSDQMIGERPRIFVSALCGLLLLGIAVAWAGDLGR